MEEDQKLNQEKIGIGAYTVQFGDLSSLEALVSQANEILLARNINLEHFAEVKKIIARIKKSAIKA